MAEEQTNFWDESVEQLKRAVLAEEPAAAVTAALGMFARFGQVVELMSLDLDRIATALEKTDVSGEPEKPATPEKGQPAAAPLDL